MFRKLRELIRRREPPVAIPVPKFTAVDVPHKFPGYAIGVPLALLGLGFYFWHTAPEPASTAAAPNVIPAPFPPTRNVPLEEHDCCEWVDPSTRSDGTHVDGYWRSKPGCAGGCSLAADSAPKVESEKPPEYVGPRGGRYHYSQNGNKVYEHHHK